MLLEPFLNRLSNDLHHTEPVECTKYLKPIVRIFLNPTSDRSILFSKSSEIATNRREDQELTMLALHLLQNSLVYINTLMLQQVLAEKAWENRLTDEDLRGLTPLFYGHINPYGTFHLDLSTRLDINEIVIP
jgi:hypothetical protein